MKAVSVSPWWNVSVSSCFAGKTQSSQGTHLDSPFLFLNDFFYMFTSAVLTAGRKTGTNKS